MYEMLKKLLPAAEEMGSIKEVRIFSGDKIYGDYLVIKGTREDGVAFELELSIEEKKDADS